jgi:TonB family protein
VLVLAMLGVLATGATAVPTDTSMRVPGTALRFGLTDTLAVARGFAPAGTGSLEGRCRFFGIVSDARLGFTDGRLARAEFTVEGTSPHQRDYVQDQLVAMGYRRRCDKLEPAASDCEWTGPARVRLTVAREQMKAVVTPPEPAEVADAGAPVPVLPETLGVSTPGHPARRGEAVVRDAPRCPAPAAAAAAGLIGRIWVLALVDVDGHVLEAAVTRGLPTLDPVALECARRWRFEPRTWQGAPCRFRVEVPILVTFD